MPLVLRHGMSAWLLSGLVGSLLLVWSLALLLQRHVEDVEVSDVRRELSSIAALVADHTDRSLQGVDLTLRLVVDRLEEIFAVGVPDPVDLHNYMREMIGPLPHLRGVLVLDAP